MIDERQGLFTPEGVELTLTLAGPVPRSVAFLLDLLIRVGVYVVAAMLFGIFLSSIAGGVLLITVFLLEWFYPVLFEILNNGQTPGKSAMKIAVTHTDGTPVTLNGSLIRNLLRTADMFPACYLAGFICMLCNRRFQRLGDMAADTVVIHTSHDSLRPVKVNVTPQLPDWPVTLDDQRTLVSFLQRGEKLSQPRRQELASLAYPEITPAQAELRALAHARHLLGGDGK